MALFEPGTHVGGARIVRVLGSGTVATVYEAIHEGARRALKIIDGTFESSTARDRFAQEGEAIAMIEHVNVVRWLGCGIDYGRPWIVLELVEGPNLRELAKAEGGRLPVERAVAIMRHVCEGLAAVHKKKIVHRDMKPENILVAADDLAKVADFGSVKLPGWGVKTTTAHRLTSMAYMPPEIWLGGVEPTEKVDVYAVALILYELSAGTNPIVPNASSAMTMCAAHLHHEPAPLASVVAEVSSTLSDLLRRAMAKDPAQRCTMRVLADELEMELDRLLAWRRSAARSLPLPNREAGLAMTMPMVAAAPPQEAPPPAPVVAPAPSSEPAARRGQGATVLMAAMPARPPDVDRTAAPPPAPAASVTAAPSSAPPSSVPSTLRTPSRPLPAAPATAAEPDGIRRTTGIPVESAARPSFTSPRRRVVHAAVAAGALVALGVGAWWTFAGREPRVEPKPAMPPPPTASASALPPPAKPPSSASATPPRTPRRPPTPVSPHR